MISNGLSPMESLLSAVKSRTADIPGLYEMFQNCFMNTWKTTVKNMPDGTTYVITGDIPAMWLRDSVCQLRPYLLLANEDEEILSMLAGLVKRQFQYILIDPYANAFNEEANGNCWASDETCMSPWIWERKYEVDSLCYPIQLAYLLWKNTGYTKHFDAVFEKGARKIIETFRTEQNHEEHSEYRFIRKDTYFTDTLSRDGKGALVRSGTGMTWSGFRPSDDACTYGYLIPSNMFAVVVLRYLSEIEDTIYKNEKTAKQASILADEIFEGIETYGITKTEEFGSIYAYETDGFGQYNLMDDANVPSLLAMSYLGYVGKNPEIAENTRRFLFSEANPTFYQGTKAKGIGSPHTPSRYIWPIALAMEGLTSEQKIRKKEVLELLMQTDGQTGMMHESFQVDDPCQYTREWFSWANAVFSELVLDYCGLLIKR